MTKPQATAPKPKAERKAMPVMTPGRAMGRRINRLIWSRPKNAVRVIAAATRVPRMRATEVAMVATFSDSHRGGQMSGRSYQAVANHCVVRPGGGNWKLRSSVVKA